MLHVPIQEIIFRFHNNGLKKNLLFFIEIINMGFRKLFLLKLKHFNLFFVKSWASYTKLYMIMPLPVFLYGMETKFSIYLVQKNSP